MAQKRISQEFLEGIHEVYSLMMAQVFLKLLDEKSTVTNIYGESKSPNKKYLEPIQLVGKITYSSELGEQDVEGVNDTVKITVPTKSLMDNNVDLSPKDNYSHLRKGVISYEGIDYEVKRVEPTTNIDNVFQFYVFFCEKPKIRR